METRTHFPHDVRLIANEWIPMSDGVRLAARIWLPKDASDHPVPAILEYIPYRKSDGTVEDDAVMHGYFAGHGYASARVDIRGAGDSEGVLRDEYTTQEHDDALEVIRWLASRHWCSGAVGMIGISWGGFNSLQVAARRPPELKAVISVCSSDDRYADDEHYMGGCLEASEMGQWATQLLVYRGLPPNPSVVGDRWRSTWRSRLEELRPTLHDWLAHQRRDDYWRHGSVCEDYGDMECAVFMVGGWEDGYRSAILRVLEHYPGLRRGLIGPWCHSYPHQGTPGPAIGFLQEALRWWDYWLQGIDNGIMDEPMLRFWMQDSFAPSGQCLPRSGRWLGEDCWPPTGQDRHEFVLTRDHLTDPPAADTASEDLPVQLRGPQVAGLDSGCWISWAYPADSPIDQRADDGLFTSFTSEPLHSPLEILGLPELEVVVRSDVPAALLAARLCDVAPEGASTLVTRGVLNLTHCSGHADPKYLVPGEDYDVTVRLQPVAYSIPAGHRVRLALSTTYWPLVWPSPRPVTLTMTLGGRSRLSLPLRGQGSDKPLPAFKPAEGAAAPGTEVIEAPCSRRTVERDVESGRTTVTWYQNMLGSRRFVDSGTTYSEGGAEIYTIVEGDPLSAQVISQYEAGTSGEGWSTRVVASDTVTADAEAFHSECVLEAFDGEEKVFARTWSERIPRDHI
jgi:uncharacterized protein